MAPTSSTTQSAALLRAGQPGHGDRCRQSSSPPSSARCRSTSSPSTAASTPMPASTRWRWTAPPAPASSTSWRRCSPAGRCVPSGAAGLHLRARAGQGRLSRGAAGRARTRGAQAMNVTRFAEAPAYFPPHHTGMHCLRLQGTRRPLRRPVDGRVGAAAGRSTPPWTPLPWKHYVVLERGAPAHAGRDRHAASVRLGAAGAGRGTRSLEPVQPARPAAAGHAYP